MNCLLSCDGTHVGDGVCSFRTPRAVPIQLPRIASSNRVANTFDDPWPRWPWRIDLARACVLSLVVFQIQAGCGPPPGGQPLGDGTITTCSGSLCNVGPWDKGGNLGAGWIVSCWVMQCQHQTVQRYTRVDEHTQEHGSPRFKNQIPGITFSSMLSTVNANSNTTPQSHFGECEHRCLLCSPRSSGSLWRCKL